jgi:hypothetical protein
MAASLESASQAAVEIGALEGILDGVLDGVPSFTIVVGVEVPPEVGAPEGV